MDTELIKTILFHVTTGVAAYVYTVFLEWFVHKYIFHVLGKRKGSRFRFHYADHHKAARKTKGGDPAFEGSVFHWNAYGREFWFIMLGIALHAPIALVAPVAWVVMSISGLRYHYYHRKSHLDIEWCKEKLPWHWDHHMGDLAASEANWCVTCEWFDKLMGTRVHYLHREEHEEEATSAT